MAYDTPDWKPVVFPTEPESWLDQDVVNINMGLFQAGMGWTFADYNIPEDGLIYRLYSVIFYYDNKGPQELRVQVDYDGTGVLETIGYAVKELFYIFDQSMFGNIYIKYPGAVQVAIKNSNNKARGGDGILFFSRFTDD